MFIGLERFEAAHSFRSAMSMTITLEKKFGIQQQLNADGTPKGVRTPENSRPINIALLRSEDNFNATRARSTKYEVQSTNES